MKSIQRGSITVEVVVMLGLISALTPLLYKQVSDRRRDIDNINEANKLLLLKEATKDYIKANKDILSVGSIVFEPIDIGIEISGYQIGIRKGSDGSVEGMIVVLKGGDDIKAAKIASLLGVSAGIYSEQDINRAWGINGIWVEDISNYGFKSLPTGIPVLTTAYDKEETTGLNEEELKEFIETTTFSNFIGDKISANEFCIKGECISSWEGLSDKNLRIIEKCNNGMSGYEEACLTAWNNSPKLNNSCQAVATVYMLAGQMPPSEFMEYRLSKGIGKYEKESCYFPAGTNKGYTKDELIYACYTEKESRTCSLMGKEFEPICDDIKNAYLNLGKESPSNGNYTVYWDGAQISYCDMSKTPAWTKIRDFSHGNTYTYILPRSGRYRFEAYGGSSSNTEDGIGVGSSKGGYTWGEFTTRIRDQFFIIVGSKGWGGGGTEIRYGLDWRAIEPKASGTHANNYLRDKYRIMVAGGAGGRRKGKGGGGNNCGTGSYPGCRGVGGKGIHSTDIQGGLGQKYIYGYSPSCNIVSGDINKGGNGYWEGWADALSVSGYQGGLPVGGFGGGGDNSGGGGGEGFGGGSGCWYRTCGNPGGGYGAGGWNSGGGYGGGGYDSSGGGGRVCLERMPSGWPSCSKDIFVFDEGGGITGGNTVANGGTEDGNGLFRIWLLTK